jgi:hypothetical protein
VQTKVHFCVLTLGYSRRQLIRVYRQQQQRHWLQALEEAFRFWGGVPEQVLVDNAKALITLNNPRTGALVINPTFAAFARHWGFTPKACWPHRPQTGSGVAHFSVSEVAQFSMSADNPHGPSSDGISTRPNPKPSRITQPRRCQPRHATGTATPSGAHPPSPRCRELQIKPRHP